MLRLLFYIGGRLTASPISSNTDGGLKLRGKWNEASDRYEPSLGHLILIDGVPDTFVVSRKLMASQHIVVARLTLRALVVLVVRNWLLSGWYAFLELACRLGFIDCSPWDIPGVRHWRWAFWKPRIEEDMPPVQLPAWIRECVNRVRALARSFGGFYGQL